jgi:hypothetical protein
VWRQWRGQQMLVSSTNEAETPNPVSPAEELEVKTPLEADGLNPRIFKPKIAIGGWTAFWLILTVIMSSTSMAGYWLLTSPPPSNDCRQNSLLASDGEKLYCAEKQAESGKLKDIQAGMAIAINLPKDHPLHNESQRLIGQWSSDLLRLAQEKVDKGDFKTANAIIKQIPATSPYYQEIKSKSQRWQKQWQDGTEIKQKFQAAIQAQNWQKARREVENLYAISSDNGRLQTREKLLAQLVAEQEGWRLLKKAQKTAQSQNLGDISAAITLSNRIKPATHARTLAQADVNQWSQIVLKAVATKYQQQDFTKAIALAKQVPKDVSVAGLAQDWMVLSQASQKAQSKQDADLLKALSALRQIKPQSPLYKEAQAKIGIWKQKLQSYTQQHLV